VNVRVYRGIAPKVRIVNLKVLDENGGGLTSTVIDAIEFAIANRAQLKIDIINLSLGHPVYEPRDTDPLVQAVEAAVRAGIVVVASAGNFGKNPDTGVEGYGGITSPGNAASAITVERSTRTVRRRALTTRSRPTAPEDRRGTTARPSRMSLRQEVISSPPRRSGVRCTRSCRNVVSAGATATSHLRTSRSAAPAWPPPSRRAWWR
jgi:subtilisin family serine protease